MSCSKPNEKGSVNEVAHINIYVACVKVALSPSKHEASTPSALTRTHQPGSIDVTTTNEG